VSGVAQASLPAVKVTALHFCLKCTTIAFKPSIAMTKVDCLGFGLVTHDRILFLKKFPQPNQKLVVQESSEQAGGPVAVGLMTMAALGLRVHWGLPLADDPHALFVKAQFQRMKIFFEEESPTQNSSLTPEAIILVDRKTGARTVLLQSQPNHHYDSYEHMLARSPEAEWLYCDGRDAALVLALKNSTKSKNAKLFFDLGSLRPHWQELIAGSAIVIVSDDFMQQLDPALQPEKMLHLLADCGVAISGITLGREGSMFLQERECLRVPAALRENIVDATNAGDVFHGAFLAAWIKTQSVARSGSFASLCAAWITAQAGHNLLNFDASLRQEFLELNSDGANPNKKDEPD